MKILDIKTTHTAPIKVLFEVLKDMLIETNVDFYSSVKKVDEDGNEIVNEDDCGCVKIKAVDTTQTVLIDVKLNGKHFDKFECTRKKITIGINLGRFYKVIKTLNKSEILSMYMCHDNINCLGVKIESPDEKKDSSFNFKLLDLPDTEANIQDKITFEAVITMESQEFNKLCREMVNIADYVEIQCLKDKIIFSCKGEFTDRKTTYKVNKDDESENILVNIEHSSSKYNDAPEIVQGIFELKNLVVFTKCASLCNHINIYMKNDYPLVIEYSVASLGRILLCLSPIKDDISKTNTYSGDDEYYNDD